MGPVAGGDKDRYAGEKKCQRDSEAEDIDLKPNNDQRDRDR